MLARTITHALVGLEPRRVEVEAHLELGVPAFAIVVNDRRELYPEILERAGLRLEERVVRHVNRRTGRRAGEYFEEILVARHAGR
jgi:hypothetical protein